MQIINKFADMSHRILHTVSNLICPCMHQTLFTHVYISVHLSEQNAFVMIVCMWKFQAEKLKLLDFVQHFFLFSLFHCINLHVFFFFSFWNCCDMFISVNMRACQCHISSSPFQTHISHYFIYSNEMQIN